MTDTNESGSEEITNEHLSSENSKENIQQISGPCSSVKTDESIERCCEPCKSEDKLIEAKGFCQTCQEYLCQECYSCHCKPKPMRHHVLLDAHQMPRSKSNETEKDEYQEYCQKHKDMIMKIYCRFHNEFGCVLCLTEEHNTCTDVSFIQDCAKGISESKEYKDMKENIKYLEKEFKAANDVAKGYIGKINEILSTVNIAKIKEQLDLVLQKIIEIKTNIGKSEGECLSMIESVSSRCMESLLELQKLIPDAKSDRVKFMQLKRAQKKYVVLNKTLKEVKVNNKELSDELKGYNVHMNCTVVDKLSRCFESPREISPIEVLSKNMFNVDNEDKKKCRITGSALLSDGRLVLVDYANENIKIFSLLEGGIDASFDLSPRPFDVTEVQRGLIAITMPSDKTISLLDISNDEICSSSVIKTNSCYYGIACHENMLFVTSDMPPKVEVLNMEGSVLQVFSTDGQGEKLFSSPRYIAINTTSSLLYVSDRDKHAVTCLSTQGDVLHVYQAKDLQRPYGLAVDASGTVFVCGRWSNNLHCLTSDCKLISSIDDEELLLKPESIAAWDKRGRLYIGLYEDDELTIIDIE